MIELNEQLREMAQTRLAKFDSRRIDDASLCSAAVVIAIAPDETNPQQASVILTRRVARLSKHAGQFALPGGKVDEGESIKQAALRELHEELGLLLDDVHILGMLDDYPTRSGFCITPVVVWAGDQHILTPSEHEVARVFHIPLTELDNDTLVLLEPGESEECPVFSIDLPTIGHAVYAPTAAMMFQFREVVLREQHTRVSHFDQPRFAWR